MVDGRINSMCDLVYHLFPTTAVSSSSVCFLSFCKYQFTPDLLRLSHNQDRTHHQCSGYLWSRGLALISEKSGDSGISRERMSGPFKDTMLIPMRQTAASI